jgi:uncharacterized membrane protein YphA (DoxX/SURF4 family)
MIATIAFLLAALAYLLGAATKAGSVVLLLGYLSLIFETTIGNVLDHFEYVAIAGYLFFRGPGRISLAGKKESNSFKSRQFALPSYRIGLGIALVALGLSEKLFGISIAQEFLTLHNWNLLSWLGVSDRLFAIIAGSIETLVGLALIFNFASRLLLLIVLGLMSTTAILLGIEEIYGHLFAVGAVAVIWVNDTKPSKKS